jgi:hypothetical protein
MFANTIGIDEVVVGISADVGVGVGVTGFKADVQSTGVGVVRDRGDVGTMRSVVPVHGIAWGKCAPRREEKTERRCRLTVHARVKIAEM